MRNQSKIYIQNQNSAVRNKDIVNVSTSSDFCIFKSPKLSVTGTTQIDCNTVECDLSSFSATTILSAVTATCLSSSTMIQCVSATTWEARIYENNNLSYSGAYYTTNGITGTPTTSAFINQINVGLTELGYVFSNTGTSYTINKKGGVYELSLNTCLVFSIPSVGCPSGYSATSANDACVKITNTGATFNGSGSTIIAGDKSGDYGQFGTYFYPEIQNDGALPVYYVGAASNLLNQTGGTITPIVINNMAPFWGNAGSSTTNGRLNNVGLSASSTEYLGFTYCLNIASGGTYYVGIGADNLCKFTLNGQLLVDFNLVVQDSFKKWSVFPVTLKSGNNIIEMYGKNSGSLSSFGAEIYAPTSYVNLTGATTTGITGANVIFSTANFVGGYWTLGSTVGYSCPSGYALNGCGSSYYCTKIQLTGTSGTSCSAICNNICTEICSNNFSYLNNQSGGVYIYDTTTADTMNLNFVFTANTNSLDASSVFKYSVYKYDQTLGTFNTTPLFVSDEIKYTTFSGTNVVSSTIPLNRLSLDGNYIIKPSFITNVCTDFLGRLGKKLDTSIYSTTNQYGIYDSLNDFYFVAISKADKPTFIQSNNSNLSGSSTIPLYQDVILVNGEETDQYSRTGSTFVLSNQYIGDLIVTLNGLSLAPFYDYTLSGTLLTFNGEIENDDIISIIYTRSEITTLKSDTILVKSPIPTGPTNSQNSNRYYFNTTTNKYEIYTEVEPIVGSSLIVMINGVTIANNIDYYRSLTDNKRIILNGTLLDGDIVTIVYNPQSSLVGGVNQTQNVINWYIPNAPENSNGNFSVEFSNYSNFTSVTISDIVEYQQFVNNYSGLLSLSGSAGTKLYYRVKNKKIFNTICGDPIESIEYSEVVPITIQTNSSDSY